MPPDKKENADVFIVTETIHSKDGTPLARVAANDGTGEVNLSLFTDGKMHDFIMSRKTAIKIMSMLFEAVDNI